MSQDPLWIVAVNNRQAPDIMPQHLDRSFMQNFVSRGDRGSQKKNRHGIGIEDFRKNYASSCCTI
jgi:hypothetical protein